MIAVEGTKRRNEVDNLSLLRTDVTLEHLCLRAGCQVLSYKQQNLKLTNARIQCPINAKIACYHFINLGSPSLLLRYSKDLPACVWFAQIYE